MAAMAVVSIAPFQESTPTPTPSPAPTVFQADDTTLWLIGMVIGGALLVGVLVWVARYNLSKLDHTESFVRSWLAGMLVIGLLAFCVLLLATDYDDLRNLVFGALVASVASAVAYYFASKDADRARQDQLNAVFGTTLVPDLVGMTVTEARSTLGGSNLRLVLPSGGPQSGVVTEQSPPAATTTRAASDITVKVHPSVPNLVAKTVAQARVNLEAAGLKLKAPDNRESSVIDTQNPDAGATVAPGTSVAVTLVADGPGDT